MGNTTRGSGTTDHHVDAWSLAAFLPWCLVDLPDPTGDDSRDHFVCDCHPGFVYVL